MTIKIPGADGPFEIVWDDIGVAHVYASSVADAYRGMGYAAGSERLWQIHLSTAYANGAAAELLGERFVAQDAIQRACNVHGGRTGLASSEGDWIVDAYLDGLNAFVDGLDDIPPEFAFAGATPRRFTRADVAARYRFTSWFQHKSWTEKMLLGRLMATHGVEYFKNHVLHFSDEDEAVVRQLREPLAAMRTDAVALAYPEVDAQAISFSSFSGSNNWAVTGALAASGKPMLATDPHQPHTIPNTFFYVHLNAGDWDAFGAAFPGVPYFMMGYTRDIAWGLTTGFVDCYDVYVEELKGDDYRVDDGWRSLEKRTEIIAIRGGSTRNVDIACTGHGPILESVTQALGLSEGVADGYGTALRWSLADVPTSAGALAQLPLAKTSAEFGDKLFESDVCPLVNNIICVDKDDGLRRFVATTMPVRSGVTGSVPLPGWRGEFDFPLSTQEQLTVEVDPPSNYAFTANNDTMGDSGDFYIHNFPTHSARADRIGEFLESGDRFSVADFQAMQLDLKDLRAQIVVPQLVRVLAEAVADSADSDVELALELLEAWDHVADAASGAPCIYYPFLDRFWPRRFMHAVLGDDLLLALPIGAPGLNRFDIDAFLAPSSPWVEHRGTLGDVVVEVMRDVVGDVRKSLGDDASQWRWGDLHQIAFKHTLAKHEAWSSLSVGPDPIGGSPTTLGMAAHMGPGPGRTEEGKIPCRVYHGPAYRLVVDLADPDHAKFVIAGGNGGRPDSPFTMNQYPLWLRGAYSDLSLQRDDLEVVARWSIEPL
jgi:penicillin amidase